LILIDSVIRENRSLFWAGICQFVYGLIELTDSIVIILISLGLFPNFYVSFISIDNQVGALLETTPAVFIGVFLFFTTLRLVSACWILQNKLKGFWLALSVTGVTLVTVWFLLPFAVIDLVCICPFLILLFRGYFGESPIVQE
jgi:hypothetical protein